jgi:metal-responsive CopG/Arc/MetJ family transcriptional regulator
MKTIAITIDDALLERMDRLSGGNRSLLVREAVAQYVVRREREAVEAEEDAVIRRHRRRLAREAAALVRVQAKR